MLRPYCDWYLHWHWQSHCGSFTKTGRFYTKVTINGQIAGIVRNKNPLKFKDVKVWASMQNTTQYPVAPVADAKIRNLSITNLYF